jgi:DNA-binding SARP family transcriptional activator
MAGCAASLIRLLSGGPEARGDPAPPLGLAEPDLEAAFLEAEVGGRAWLIRTARAVLNGRTDPVGPDVDRDPWGRALATLVDGLARRSVDSLSEAAEGFTALGAPIPAQWAVCLRETLRHQITPGGSPGLKNAAERQARILGLRDALPVIHTWTLRDTASPETVSETIASPAGAAPAAPIRLRLFGGLEITVGDQAVDLRGVRPRARSTLRLLALRAGDLVHREALAAELWPDHDEDSALRGLQVAVSSLRSLLGPALAGPDGPSTGGSGRSRDSLLIRVGQNYGLSLPTPTDVQEFETCLGAARSARLDGKPGQERAQLQAGLALYRGELLPEEGIAEWVLTDRERLRLAAASAAEALARSLADSDQVDEAIDAVRSCLRLEPYRDKAWRLLIELHTSAGNLAAAEAARLEHEEILAGLGL